MTHQLGAMLTALAAMAIGYHTPHQGTIPWHLTLGACVVGGLSTWFARRP